MANREKIDQVLGAITEETLSMENWGKRTPCGTTMCFAGHAVVNDGHELKWESGLGDWLPDEGRYSTIWYAEYTKDGQYIPTLAKSILGLETIEAEAIFYRTSIDSVSQLSEHIDKVLADPEYAEEWSTGELCDYDCGCSDDWDQD